MAWAEAYLHAKFHFDPSNSLAAIHQRYRQDRTDRQTGQLSHSIGRTVLPMVAQKRKQGNRVTLRPRCAFPSPHAATEWSVLLLNDVICSERITVHCVIGEENPQNCAFPLGFCHRAGGGPNHGHKQHAQKVGKDPTCGTGDIVGQTDRQTDKQTRYTDHNASPPVLRAK